MTPADPRHVTGSGGELFVAEKLRAQGVQILAHDISFGRFGQIDLIVKDRTTLWAIEVKTRAHQAAYGGLSDSLSNAQLRRIRQCLTRYAQDIHWEGPLAIGHATVTTQPDPPYYKLVAVVRVL